MRTKYAARHTTADETRKFGHCNGVVEDITFTPKRICFVTPMAMAIRIASSLNVCERFERDELIKMSDILINKD